MFELECVGEFLLLLRGEGAFFVAGNQGFDAGLGCGRGTECE